MTKSRGIFAPRKPWTEQDLLILRVMYPKNRTDTVAGLLERTLANVYRKATKLGLRKTEAFLASAASGRLDGQRGSPTRFKPGNVPWCAGKKGLSFSPATQFKRGSVPANVQEVGALRINGLGDLDIKVAEGKGQWLSMRRYVWEMAYGPVPPKMCVSPLDGDGHNTQLENLRLVTRAENIAINLHKKYPKELRHVMQLSGRLRNRVANLEKTQKENLNG